MSAELNVLFTGTDVYLKGKYHFHCNEILTAYLNLTDVQFQKAQEDYDDLVRIRKKLLLEEYMTFEKKEFFTKNFYDAILIFRRVDELRLSLPPYNKLRVWRDIDDMALIDLMDKHYDLFTVSDGKKIQIISRHLRYYNPFHFKRYMDEKSFERLLKEIEKKHGKNWREEYPSYRENVEQLPFFYPENAEGLVHEKGKDVDFTTEKVDLFLAQSAYAYNEELEYLFADYIPYLEAVLRVKHVYAPFLHEQLHRRHAFPSANEIAEEYDALTRKQSMAAKAYTKLIPSDKYVMTHETITDENDLHVLCERYDFDGLGALLYVDFFKGLFHQYLPKKCYNCNTWFLLKHGQYSDYCENPSPIIQGKTCRESGARMRYEDKCKNDPVWQTYHRAYKTHYARYMKKKMTQSEFEEWGTFAIRLRNQAADGQIDFEDYTAQIRE